MCFVDGKNQTVRALEYLPQGYRIVDLKLSQIFPWLQSETKEAITIEVEERWCFRKDFNALHDAHLSEDGNTLMISEPGSLIKVYRFNGDGLLKCEGIDSELFKEEDREYDRANSLLSPPNGHSLFAVYHQAMFQRHQPLTPYFSIVAIWPELRFDGSKMPDHTLVKGDDAVWTASGKHLAVWDKKGETPRLCVFNIEYLASGKKQVIPSRTLNPGLSDWKAMSWRGVDPLIIIREDYKNGKQQYLVRSLSSKPITFFCPVEENSETSEDERSLTMELANRSHQCCYIDDHMHWIANCTKNPASFAITSLRSGTRMLDFKLPDNDETPEEIICSYEKGCFLVIRSKDIVVLAPAFLQDKECLSSSMMETPQKGLWVTANAFVKNAFAQLNNHDLAKLCNSYALIRSRAAFSGNFYRVAMSMNNTWGAWIGWKLQSAHAEYSLRAGTLNVLRSQNPEMKEWMTELNEIPLGDFQPKNVFFFPRNNQEHIVFFASEPKPELLFFEMDGWKTWGQGHREELDLEDCLHVSQTRDRRRLVIVEKTRVCLLNLDNVEIEDRIPYKTNIGGVFEHLRRYYRFDDSWWRKYMDRRRVSDDGRTLLIGWDEAVDRSFLITPETEQHECDAVLEAVSNRLSPFCKLTGNGYCTLFADIDELSLGKLVIGIHPHEGAHETYQTLMTGFLDRRARHRICVHEDNQLKTLTEAQGKQLLFSEISCEMTDDGAEMVVFTAPQWSQVNYGCRLEKEIKTFNIYEAEDCIPDYRRIASSPCTTASEKIERMARRFGPEWVCNHPSSNKKSIFQEAFVGNDGPILKDVMHLAEDHGIKIAAQWMSLSADVEQGAKTEDLLMHSLRINPVGKVEEAILFMKSSVCTDQDIAWMWSRNFAKALELNPQRVIKALLNDEFVKELCRIEVNADFLDPVIRRKSAVHVTALDDLLSWEFEGDPAILSAKWKGMNSEDVEKMEKGGDCATATAALNAVCIEGVALPGNKGLIRQLLLDDVPEHVFDCKAVKWIVSHKWFTFWRQKFLRKAGWHCVFLLCLTVYSMILGRMKNLVHADPKFRVSATFFLPFLWFYGVWTTTEETKQISSLLKLEKTAKSSKWRGLQYYLTTRWSWVNIASCLLLVFALPMFHLLSILRVEWNHALSEAVAIEIILTYIKVWYFAQPYRETGALVLMIDRIIRDCFAFFSLSLIIMVGYALAIHVMFRSIFNEPSHHEMDHMTDHNYTNSSMANDASMNSSDTKIDEDVDNVKESFGTFRRSILTLFYALFGNIESEVYSTSYELHRLIVPTFAAYMITQFIVMLNLLIAIMTDTFDRVKCNEEGQMQMARAMIIDFCEASASKVELDDIERKTGKYICALKRVKHKTEKSMPKTWTCRISMLIDKFKSVVYKSEDVVKRAVEDKMNNMQKELIDAINANFSEQNQRITQLEARVEQISLDLNAKLEERLSLESDP